MRTSLFVRNSADQHTRSKTNHIRGPCPVLITRTLRLKSPSKKERTPMRPDINLMFARRRASGTAKLQLGEFVPSPLTGKQIFFAPNPDKIPNSLQPQQNPTRTEPGLNPDYPGLNPETPGIIPDEPGFIPDNSGSSGHQNPFHKSMARSAHQFPLSACAPLP